MISISESAKEAGVEWVGKMEDRPIYLFRTPDGRRFSCHARADEFTGQDAYVRHLKFHASRATWSAIESDATGDNLASWVGR